MRIQGLERKFSGEIQRLTLAFTNRDYLRAFSQVNSAPIKQGLLRAVSA